VKAYLDRRNISSPSAHSQPLPELSQTTDSGLYRTGRSPQHACGSRPRAKPLRDSHRLPTLPRAARLSSIKVRVFSQLRLCFTSEARATSSFARRIPSMSKSSSYSEMARTLCYSAAALDDVRLVIRSFVGVFHVIVIAVVVYTHGMPALASAELWSRAPRPLTTIPKL
jgi:hypothetical protein